MASWLNAVRLHLWWVLPLRLTRTAGRNGLPHPHPVGDSGSHVQPRRARRRPVTAAKETTTRTSGCTNIAGLVTATPRHALCEFHLSLLREAAHSNS